ncbi:hypothetical protein V8F33_009741 [Rhypophila sp. PSN 637]
MPPKRKQPPGPGCQRERIKRLRLDQSLPPDMAALTTLPSHQINVIISERGLATRTANTVLYSPKINEDGKYCLNFFCDGSLQLHQKPVPGIRKSGQMTFKTGTARPGGYSVVCGLTGEDTWGFAGKAYEVDEAYSITQCEKMGIAESLAMAVRKVKKKARSVFSESSSDNKMVPVGKAKYDNSIFRVFVDATNSLTQIRDGVRGDWTGCLDRDHTRPIDLVIIDLSERLRARGCVVELHWVPRNDTPQHKMADFLSKKGWNAMFGGEPFRLAERSEETRDLDAKVTKAVDSWFSKLKFPNV